MTQEAGFASVSRSLRSAVDEDASVRPTWSEVSFSKSGGTLSRLHDRLPFLPYHPFGVAQEVGGVYRALRSGRCAAWYTNSLMASYFPRTFGRTPTVYSVDATPAQLERMSLYGIQKSSPVTSQRYRRFFQKTRLIMAFSEWARQSFIHDYGVPENQVIVRPPGVNLKYWQHVATDDASSPRRHPVRILFVGTDFQRKNGPLLLDWFGQQPAGSCELHLATAGEIHSAPGVYVYRGLQPNTPELLRLFQSCDIFILPSLAECFGNATVEAMAVGLPVVQTNVGGVADIICEGENGHIIPPNDPAALDAVLKSLINDPSKRRRMGRAGREIAEKKFDLERNCHRVIEDMKAFSR